MEPDDEPQRVWVIISPRGAMHAAEIYDDPLESVPGASLSWLRFPCMGPPERSPRDVAVCTPDRKEALEAARFVGSWGVMCLKPHCQRAHREA